MFKKIKMMFMWLFSRKVGQAINEGASYDEVQAMIEEELKK